MLNDLINLLINETIDERKKVSATKPKIYFHGTSSKFLQSILSKGMLANPKDKKWDEESSITRASIYDPSLASLPGSYWTQNFMTAYSAASGTSRKFGDNRIIIVAQISPKETLPDEDNFGRLQQHLKESIQQIYGNILNGPHKFIRIAPILLKEPELIQQGVDYFITHFHSYYKSTENQPPNQELIKFLIQTCLNRVWAHSVKTIGGKNDFIYAAEQEFRNPKLSYEELQEMFENFELSLNVTNAEREYKRAQDLFGRYYRKTSLSDDTLHNVRYPKDLGFTNRSKIVGIIELDRDYSDEATGYKILYANNNVNNNWLIVLLNEFRKNIGNIVPIK